jgi:hypothetical protein
MKTNIHLDFSQQDNFQKAVAGYINDNLPYIKEMATSNDSDGMAKGSLDHYNATVAGYEQDDEQLSDEQKEIFLATARRLFEKGYYA